MYIISIASKGHETLMQETHSVLPHGLHNLFMNESTEL